VRVVSTVKSRPNYYELLGLAPGAAGDAVAQAFARATSVFRPHAFGSITEICVAFETLRDPIKRRAYDASLGLVPKDTIPPVSRPASAHFMQRPDISPPLPAPPANPEPRPAPRIDLPPEPSVAPIQFQPTYNEVSGGISPIEWKRTGLVVGGLVAAAVFVGALAGWWSGSSAAEPEQAKPAATAPQDKPPPSFSELWPEPASSAVETRTFQPRGTARARPRGEPAPRRTQLVSTEAERQLVQPPQDLAEPTPSDPLAPEAAAAPAPAAASAMPLPHKTVARTIDRIGYSCGSVASATPIEGTAGIYKVTCSSGQSFQAKPVNGRYRFRRLAGN